MKVSLSQENKFLQSRRWWGESCIQEAAAASDAVTTVLSLQLVITFPAKDSLLPLSASKLRGGREQE